MTASPEDQSSAIAGSFRDPSGFLFVRDGVLYRQVNAVHASDYDLLFSSGLYEELTEATLLIPHQEVSVEPAVADGAYKVLRPEVVDFISYPYEWGFGQLKDAALVTLEIQRRALERGMTLRDASAYNIQFHRGRPVLIDTLSFERLHEGKPWIAYRQFCQHFLAPLALMSYRDVRLGQLARIHIDGVPLDIATRLLPFRARLRISLLLHLFVHARSQRRHADDPGAAETRRGRTFTLQAFKGLIESLRGAVEKLRVRAQASQWVDYYGDASHYTPEALANKKKLVERFLDEAAPSTVWDLGANTGLFSSLASDRGIRTIAFDMDAGCVDQNYKRVKEEGDRNLLPLILDLTNPSPAIGWANEERATLVERGRADLVMALALVHHLAIGNNVPLPAIADHFARFGRRLIIEFVPKEDEKVRHLLATREDIFPGYTRAGFEEAFKARFDTERAEEIEGSERVLYLMRAR